MKFHVLVDDCQVSLVSIAKFADGSAIFDTATGVYSAKAPDDALSVVLPCGQSSETDLVLGPPTLYPPSDLDLGAFPFRVDCPAPGGSTGGGDTSGGGAGSGGDTSGGGGGGGGSSGGGGDTSGSGAGGSAGNPLPDLAATITAPKTKGVALGTSVPITVSVKNKGAGDAGGVHVLVSISDNGIPKNLGKTSRGPGCTSAAALLDCNLGSLGSGEAATITVPVVGVRGRKVFIGAQVQQIQNDTHLADNTDTLTIGLVPRLIRLTLSAHAAKYRAGEQFVSISVSRRATVTAQAFVRGVAQPIVWRRTVDAGTFIIRVPVPGVTKGQPFTLVLLAKNGSLVAKTRLNLKA